MKYSNNKWLDFFRVLLAPLALAVYPVFFHYANNINIASAVSVANLLLLFVGLVFFVFIIIYKVFNFSLYTTANVTSLLMFFFHSYGVLYMVLKKWDVIQIRHYSILPVIILLNVYLAWGLSAFGVKSTYHIWTATFVLFGGLTVFNLVPIVYNSVQILKSEWQNPNVALSGEDITSQNKDFPDIYYIVFDEMAGFGAVRDYWNYSDVDQFVSFLQERDFYVAERSYASAPSTINQLASRLNYRDYSYDPNHKENVALQQAAISDNRVMNKLKSLGYTTIAFMELRKDFPVMEPMDVDFLYEESDNNTVYSGAQNIGFFDDFTVLVLDNTALQPFIGKEDLLEANMRTHKDMIFFTLNEVSQLAIADSPKVVFVHLIFPHAPFLFDRNGRVISPTEYYDWNSYLGQYIYSIDVGKQLLDDILAFSGDTPPVIIFQSDHGARNFSTPPFINPLADYPDEYKTWIVNAMLLPDCDDAPLTQDINPTNTFPIVFNCYFDIEIPLQ